jgi:hypothetical protein
VKATFTTSELHDALQKALAIAPAKGAAFDRSGGIYIRFDKFSANALVEATDGERHFSQYVPCQLEDDAEFEVEFSLRFTTLFAEVVSRCPMHEESSIQLVYTKGSHEVRVVNAVSKTFVKMRLIAGEFPFFMPFDDTDEDMTDAGEIQSKLDVVAWAVSDNASSKFHGVHFDGEHVYGCNADLAVRIPCKVPLSDPATVVIDSSISNLIARGSAVRVRASGEQFLVSLDQHTQVRTQLINQEYPTKALVGIFATSDHWCRVSFLKQTALDALGRASIIVRSGRLPGLHMTVNVTGLVPTLDFDLSIPGGDRMRASIDIETDASENLTLKVPPYYIQGAVQAARGGQLIMKIGTSDPAKPRWKNFIYLTDQNGYEAVFMPMHDV